MRIASGVVDQYIYFIGVDSTDLKTRETGLTTFTVYRSRNGGAATVYTTPTVAELSAANMPGVYSLLLDEDMTIDAGDETQEICLHITQASMAPVTRVIELYRPKITAGNTLGVAADGDISGNVDGAVASVTGAVGSVTGAVGSVTGAVGSVTGAVGSVTGAVGSVTAGVTLAAGAVTAAAVATGAIDADALATDAVAEIADGVWDEARAGHVAVGSFGEGQASVQGNVTGSVASVTGAVGSVTGAVGSVTAGVTLAAGAVTAAAVATGAIDADALAADAVAEIADGVWDEPKAGHITVTTFGDLATDLDTVAVDVAGLDGAAMRGTDNAALASVCTEGRLAELDAANLPATTDSILTDTAVIGAAGAGLTDLGGMSTTMKAQVNTEADTALTDIDLDHLIQVTAGVEEPTDGAYLDQIMHKAVGQTFDDTTDSLEALRDTAPMGTAMRGTDSAALAADWTAPLATALGSYTAALATALGNYTAVRAGYLDNINQAGLLQITVARAGYLDNLSGGAVALAASWTAALATALGNYTAARAAYLDNINQVGLLQVTAARAALLDEITALRLAELDPANLPADIAAIVANVWDELIAGHLGVGSTGEALNGASTPTAAQVADAVLDELTSTHTTDGSLGERVQETNERQRFDLQ